MGTDAGHEAGGAPDRADDARIAIQELKARYCRLLDAKDWAGFRGLFTDGFVSDTTGSGGPLIVGADEFVAFVRRTLARAVTVHQVQQPEIVLESASTARAIWAMQDIVRFLPGVTLHGFGHYHEAYERSDDGWRIAASRLTRLREEIRTPVVTLFVSERVRRAMARVAARSLPGGSGPG